MASTTSAPAVSEELAECSTALYSLFPTICSLKTYLNALISGSDLPSSWTVQLPSDDAEFSRFLQETFVARAAQAKPALPPSQTGEVLFSQAEVVNSAIEKILKGSGPLTPNVLTLGYRNMTTKGGNRVVGTHGVENFFPNTIVNELKSRCWELLLSRIGVRAMSDLLVNTTMFNAMPGRCSVQLSGIPLGDDAMSGKLIDAASLLVMGHASGKRKRGAAVSDNSASKKRRLQDTTGHPDSNVLATVLNDYEDGGISGDLPNSKSTLSASRKANSGISTAICFTRRRIFCARPVRGSSNSFLFGLPKTHSLNQAGSNSVKAEDVGPIMREVFPVNYALPSPFLPAAPNSDARNGQRNGDIATTSGKPGKVPWRLRAAGKLVCRMRKMHHACNYRALLERHCPPCLASAVPVPEKAGCVLNAHSSFHQVSSFVHAAVSQVIPNDLLGSDHNWSVIKRAMNNFIRIRRYETMSLQNVVQGFKINECSWAMDPRPIDSKTRHIPPSETLKRTELVFQLLFWLFESFLIPLIKTTFYCTESAPFRNKIFYFRHDVWHGLTGSIQVQLATKIFRQVDPVEYASGSAKSLGYSYIRLLPKDHGVRMITNLRRRFPKKAAGNGAGPADASKIKQNGFSINSILQNAFQILTFEKAQSRTPPLLGSSVLGLNDIYAKLYKFQKSRPVSSKTPAPLYFCKVDVTSCFDTIDQKLLLSIVRDIFLDEEYLVQRYTLVYPTAGRFKKSYIRRARPSPLAKSLAEGMRETVLVDQVVYNFEETRDILRLLEEHICNNLIKMGKKIYKQLIGIPQGSVLSTLLCSFFYAHMERTNLAKFATNDMSLLLRYVDDFLFITESRAEAIEFLQIMHRGHPSHGCVINADKTLVNFPAIIDGKNIQNIAATQEGHTATTAFPWCGLLIDTMTLHVKADYGRFAHTQIGDTLTVEGARRPGFAFKYKLMQMLKPKSHPIFLDANFNSPSVVLLNFYQNIRMCASKFVAYVQALPAPPAGGRTSFLYNTVQDAMQFAFAMARSRTPRNNLKDNNRQSPITRVHIEWLGLYAFAEILREKQTQFTDVLTLIDTDLRAERFRRVKRRLLPIVYAKKSTGLRDVLI
ncbi:hypothetical protein HKX48_001768 [Thoreauomyces humboldtii]|nr:hypothetical protein HKX48_001768 [Thoreauomyces humboldtii]